MTTANNRVKTTTTTTTTTTNNNNNNNCNNNEKGFAVELKSYILHQYRNLRKSSREAYVLTPVKTTCYYLSEKPKMIIIISGDHPDYSIIKISQNTEKSPGNLRRLAVTQTLEEDHQLTLVGKTLKN